ncbi:MAG TPA: SCP2 sterol-binding domain-containing protein, partial [Nevskiaceae bacterium]|nr:SCP2 sterol-binding domain-containing protein [Nevskiaceae bacterium]
MKAPDLLLAAVEVALNRFLGLEADALAECAKLAGRAIALHANGPEWTFFIEFHPGGVRVLPTMPRTPNVSISATPLVLLRQGLHAGSGGALPQGLTVEGDVALLTRFQELLARVGFDPEELAAKYLGDAAAHRLVQGAEKLFGWGRKTAQTLALDTSEYLREETRDLA